MRDTKRYAITIKVGISAYDPQEAKDKIIKLLSGKILRTGKLYLNFNDAVAFSDIKTEEISELK